MPALPRLFRPCYGDYLRILKVVHKLIRLFFLGALRGYRPVITTHCSFSSLWLFPNVPLSRTGRKKRLHENRAWDIFFARILKTTDPKPFFAMLDTYQPKAVIKIRRIWISLGKLQISNYCIGSTWMALKMPGICDNKKVRYKGR